MVNATLCEMLDLQEIGNDLFESFEEGVKDRDTHIDDYVRRYARKQEMDGFPVAAHEVSALSDILKKGVLTAYDDFCEAREEIFKKRGKRRFIKYLAWTAGITTAIVLLVTRAKVGFGGATTIAGVSGVGSVTAYWISHQWDHIKVQRAKKKKFDKKMKKLQGNLQDDALWEYHRSEMYGAVSEVDVAVICREYEDPKTFFDEYAKLRRADPTTESEFRRLNTSRLRDFIGPHLADTLEPVEREARFNDLYIEAEKFFLNVNPGYAQRLFGEKVEYVEPSTVVEPKRDFMEES
jgi:hypothetical protein